MPVGKHLLQECYFRLKDRLSSILRIINLEPSLMVMAMGMAKRRATMTMQVEIPAVPMVFEVTRPHFVDLKIN